MKLQNSKSQHKAQFLNSLFLTRIMSGMIPGSNCGSTCGFVSVLFSAMISLNAYAFNLPTQEVLLSGIRSDIDRPVLSNNEQQITLDQLYLIYDQMYAHLDIKINVFRNAGIDPAAQISRMKPQDTMAFLKALAFINLNLRDLHQYYQWPRPFSCLRTFVPIDLGLAAQVGFDKKIVISGLSTDEIKHSKLQASMKDILKQVQVGDVVTHIDDKEIWSVLQTAMIFGAGSNEDAHLHEGIKALTWISQRIQDLPNKDFMKLTLKNEAGSYSINVPYLVNSSPSCFMGGLSTTKPTPQSFSSSNSGINQDTTTSSKLFQNLGTESPTNPSSDENFDPLITSHGRPIRIHPDFEAKGKTPGLSFRSRLEEGLKQKGTYKVSPEPTIGSATLDLENLKIGYLRIESFSPDKEIDEVEKIIIKILTQFETNTRGLIIDVRGNPGGSYGDNLTQYFTPKKVVSQTEEMRASSVNKDYIEKKGSSWLTPYLPSIKEGIKSGKRYSDRLEISDQQFLNSKGQIYTKSVVLLADPGCYSYCDYFSTSMQDHDAAEVWIENGKNTGGGGALVLSYSRLTAVMESVFKKLPQQQEVSIAFTSGYRTGLNSGKHIENFGADADFVYQTTFNDILNHDEDLMNALGKHFKKFQ